MLQVTHHDGDMIEITASGWLTSADHNDKLIPKLESLMAAKGRLRVVFSIGPDFRGWTLPAAWANTLFDIGHRKDFEKIAMVGAPAWENWCVEKLASLLMRGELKTFKRCELAAARAWVNSQS